MMKNAEKHRNLHRRLQRELESIGRGLNRSMEQVLTALERRDTESATKLLGWLRGLQEREDGSKEICLQILAGRNGNTPELRWTGRAYKILSLMERSSVEIAAIAEQIAEIKKGPDLPIAKDLPHMGLVASQMLELSIRTALHPDAENARKILEKDASLDNQREAFAKRAIAFTEQHPDHTKPVIPYVLISWHLEKIGDHASHIAEEVAYHLKEQAA